MKKLLYTLLGILIAPVLVYGASVFTVKQGGTGTSTVPVVGYVLVGQSNGSYAPQATSTLGISGGGGISGGTTGWITYFTSPTTVAGIATGTAGQFLAASSTSPSGYGWQTVSGAGTVTSVDMTVPTGLTVSGNPITAAGTLAVALQGGYIIPLIASTTQWSNFYNASNTFVTFTYASSTYPSYSYGSSSYYLATNPSGFITSSALTPYMTLAYGSSTYMPLASSSLFYLATNPSGYITNSVSTLTNYPTYTYASSTFASTSYVVATYAPKASPTFTGTVNFTNASGTGITATHYGDFYPAGLSNTWIAVGTNGKLVATTTPSGGSGGTFSSSSAMTIGTLYSTSTLNITGLLRDLANASGTSGQVLSSTGNGVQWVTNAAAGVSGSGLAGLNAIWTSPSNLGNGSIMDDGTVSGVHATSSLYDFYILGSGTRAPLVISSSSGAIGAYFGSNGSFGVGTSTFNSDPVQKEIVKIDCGATTTDCFQAYSNVNSFHQILATNFSTGINATAGFTAENSLSTPTSTFMWIGINGAGFATTTVYDVGSANDTGIIGKGNNMYITNASTTGFMSFLTGGTATTTNTRMTILSNGNIGIGSTTPVFGLGVTGTLGVVGNTTLGNASTTNISASGNAVITGTTGLTGKLTFVNATGTSLTINQQTYLGSTTVKHLIGTAVAPTFATSTGVGTGAGSTKSNQGNDVAGLINVFTTNAPAANAVIGTLTFNQAYASVPYCVLTSATTSTATVWATTTTTTLSIRSNTALVGTSSYAWYYMCAQ